MFMMSRTHIQRFICVWKRLCTQHAAVLQHRLRLVCVCVSEWRFGLTACARGGGEVYRSPGMRPSDKNPDSKSESEWNETTQ